MNKLNRNSTVAEANEVALQILTAYDHNRVEDEQLARIITDLRKQSDQMTTAIGQEKTASNLEALDLVRDTNWTDLYYMVQGYTHAPDENMRKAAEKLSAITEKYGLAVIHESYSAQTAYMETALESLEGNELQAAARELPCIAELIAMIRRSQSEFHEAKVRLQEAQAEEANRISASERKKKILQIINSQLLTYLEAMKMIMPDRYNKFAELVAEIIGDANVNVRRRK